MNERIYSSACINQLNNLVYQLLCCMFRFQVFKKRKRKKKKKKSFPDDASNNIYAKFC